MRVSGLLGGGAAVALAFAASAAVAGGPMGYGGYAPGQCGAGGCGAPGPVGFGPGQPAREDYPPNAAPGQCFTKVLVPEIAEAVTEHVLVAPEKTELRVIPGQCRLDEKSVLVKEETVDLIAVPATYRTVTETVVVKPGYSRTETIAATYETVSEQVKVRDGYTEWRPGATVAGYASGVHSYGYGPGMVEHNPAYGGMTTRVLPTGEVLCLVEVPPEFRTIAKQVLRTPARAVEIPVPPETRIITRQVVDVPAHTDKRIIPAVFETVKIKVCGGDTTQSYAIPPVYSDVVKTRIVAPSRFEWKQVECHAEPVVERPHYAPPPPRVFYEAPRPRPVYHHPVYVAPAPIPRARQCHTTTTCVDAPRPAPMAAPQKRYDRSDVTEAAPTYRASNDGGDRAVVGLQGALASRGYYAGPQNGLFTQDTMRAMVKYQNDNHLNAGRYTGETANALGIASR